MNLVACRNYQLRSPEMAGTPPATHIQLFLLNYIFVQFLVDLSRKQQLLHLFDSCHTCADDILVWQRLHYLCSSQEESH